MDELSGISRNVSGCIGSSVGCGVSGSILLSIVLVWSIVVDIMGLGAPVLLSLGVDWLVVLGGVSRSIRGGVSGKVGSSVDSFVGCSIGGDVGSGVKGDVLLSESNLIEVGTGIVENNLVIEMTPDLVDGSWITFMIIGSVELNSV